jgi:hypothetical protein
MLRRLWWWVKLANQIDFSANMFRNPSQQPVATRTHRLVRAHIMLPDGYQRQTTGLYIAHSLKQDFTFCKKFTKMKINVQLSFMTIFKLCLWVWYDTSMDTTATQCRVENGGGGGDGRNSCEFDKYVYTRIECACAWPISSGRHVDD